MKVVFCIPAGSGLVHVQCVKSLMQAQSILELKKIENDLFFISNCPVLSVARDSLVAMFMQDEEATDLFFIDSDVGFDPLAVLKILEREEEIVAGIYPLKRDAGGFPVVIKERDGCPVTKTISEGVALVEASLLPTGFMRIKRSVFEQIAAAHPELRYKDNVVKTDDVSLHGAFNFFGMGIYEGQFRTEDYAFCQRWRDMGGRLWVYPDIDFEHVGMKAYKANYHQHLMGV